MSNLFSRYTERKLGPSHNNASKSFQVVLRKMERVMWSRRVANWRLKTSTTTVGRQRTRWTNDLSKVNGKNRYLNSSRSEIMTKQKEDMVRAINKSIISLHLSTAGHGATSLGPVPPACRRASCIMFALTWSPLEQVCSIGHRPLQISFLILRACRSL